MIDTSVAIALRDGHPAVLARLAETDETVMLSIVTWVELEGGVTREPRSARQRRAALDAMLEAYSVRPFGSEDAGCYRAIVEASGFSRRKLLDRMIAAQAIAARATLATLNVVDFSGIEGLSLQNWA